MPHASSELVFGPGDGWPLSPTSSCGRAIPAVAASPSAAGPGCISVSHDTTQEGGHNTSVCLRSGPHMHTHTAALSPHLQHTLLLASSSSCDSRAASTCTASPLSGRPEEEGWDSWSASSSPALEELLRCPPTPERTGVLGRGPPVPAAPVRSPVAADRAEPVVPPNSFENNSK